MSNYLEIKICMISIFALVFVAYLLLIVFSGDSYSACDKDTLKLFMTMLVTLSIKTLKIDCLIPLL
jgi:hypothetical protein